MRDYNKLRAFVLADEIPVATYLITKHFPKEEMYGLTAQMRRAAISIPSNIVEGSSRETDKEFVRFLEIAYSSLKELQYQYGLSVKLKLIKMEEVEKCVLLCHETSKVLGSLILKIKNK
ncbi:MAG: four helix bundle protein [Saprospiraceae bacterium]|nr:four helix bundle protein [Saprospiraceae bacterium]